MSIHPDHYFPNAAPKGCHMIDNRYRLMKDDICWNMETDTWHPINPRDVGRTGSRYIRVARPNVNSVTGLTRRFRIEWRRLADFPDKMAGKMLLFKTHGEIVRGTAHAERDFFGIQRTGRYESFYRESIRHATDGLIHGVVAWAPYKSIR
jgi:hypothetical protein